MLKFSYLPTNVQPINLIYHQVNRTMKRKRLYLYVIMIALFSISCSELERDRGIVERNCSGVYFKNANKNYKINNEEMMTGFDDGCNVEISFGLITENIKNGNKTICELSYPHKGIIEIIGVK